MNLSESASAGASSLIYFPGYGKCKWLMILYGIVLFISGFVQIWHPLSLVLWGSSTKADVVAVVKTKSGQPDRIVTKEAELKNLGDERDRSVIFWNQFEYLTPAGERVEITAPVGSRVKPLYRLLDENGLPTTDTICYLPSSPHTVVFPLIISTWFFALVLISSGGICIIGGTTLLYWSNRPIELPQFPLLTTSFPRSR